MTLGKSNEKHRGKVDSLEFPEKRLKRRNGAGGLNLKKRVTEWQKEETSSEKI